MRSIRNGHLPDAGQLRAVLLPIERARGLPNVCYTDADCRIFERDAVLARTWVCIGFADDLPRPGAVLPVDFMGWPLLIARGNDDVLRVFHNVCSHRGLRLVTAPCNTQGLIRCPYHSWTYNLQGQLKTTPHVGGVDQHTDPRFDCAQHGLRPVRCAQWMGLLFVNLSGTAEDFAIGVEPLEARWRPLLGSDGYAQLRYCAGAGTLEFDVRCNWKLAVENYCESYHLPWVHPALNSYSRLEDHYPLSFAGRYAGQGSHAYNLAVVAGMSLPVFPAWPASQLRTAEYVAMFPNVLLGIQADHVFVMVLDPLAPERTRERLRVYFVGEQALDARYAASRQAVHEAWRQVFMEDVAVVEGMQAGRASPGFGGGAFSPAMDGPTHYFHCWAAREMLAAIESREAEYT